MGGTKNSVIVSDIGFAAYLKVIVGIGFKELPCKNERVFEFNFDLNLEELNQYKIDYLNSLYRKFDQEVRDLKKLLNRI